MTSLDNKSMVVEQSVISRFNLNGPAVVAASAGTGKTYTITGLVVRLLLGDDIARPLLIEEIMLMTFTNAATRDMKRKVREKIEEIYDCFLNPTNVTNSNTFEYDLLHKNNDAWLQESRKKLALKLLKNAMTSMDKANISTIHSFCGGLLKKYAMDSMYDIGSTLVNDDKEIKQEAIYKVIQKYMYELSGEEIEALAFLTENSWVNYTRSNIGDLTRFLSPYYTDKERQFLEYENELKTIKDIIQKPKEYIDKYKKSNVYNLIQNIVDNWNTYSEVFKVELTNKFKKAKPSSPDVFIPMFLKDTNILSSSINSRKKKSYPEIVKEIDEITEAIKIIFDGVTTSNINVKQYVTHIILKEAAVIYKELKEKQRIITNDDLLINLRDALQSKTKQADLVADDVRQQYPVAIIDEFQDTDPVQFSIVSKLYLSFFGKKVHNEEFLEKDDQDKESLEKAMENDFCGFYIIGDKKQSIYRFRGADVSCYEDAVKKIKLLFTEEEKNRHIFTLDKNFRSTEGFVNATNELFKLDIISSEEPKSNSGKSKENESENLAILRSEGFDFEPVKANGLKYEFYNNDKNHHDNGNFKQAPVQIACIDSIKGNTKEYLAKLCVNQIVYDLSYGRFIKNSFDENSNDADSPIPIKPNNLTVLVRSSSEYSIIEKALSKVGLTSVYCSDRRSIKQTKEFESILSLMKAVDNPQDRGNIRNLLVSSFFANDIELYEQNLTDTEYEVLINVLSDCKEKWLDNTIFDMYVHFMNNFKILTNDKEKISIHEHLLRQSDGMARLTNLQHAAEIAQKYSSNVAVQTDLIPLFENIINNNTLGDEDEIDSEDSMKLRLSGDENTIKVYTYHSSKGLEYDIVYMPFIGSSSNCSVDVFTINEVKNNDKKFLDISLSTQSKNFEIQQTREEELRLWYVAATRPKYKMYLWFNKNQKNYKSEVFKMLVPLLDNESIFIPELFNIINDTFIPNLAYETYKPLSTKNYDEYKAKVFTGEINNDWHITSYSSISKKIKHEKVSSFQDNNNKEPDELDELDFEDESVEFNSNLCFKFTKGANAGDFLHKVLEEIDFKKAYEDPSIELIPKIQELLEVSHLPLEVKKSKGIVDELAKWIINILKTPLDEKEEAPLMLLKLGNDKCLKEMEFLMKLGNDSDSTAFTNKLFEISKNLGLRDKDYPRDRNIGSLQGLLIGFIDLFFMHNGKFYVADYKSNSLGNDIKLYTASNIKKSMVASNYDIQFLIYSVAAYRYLRNIYGKNGEFDFKKHFGGVYYLYLRGMNGVHYKYGVYHKEVDDELVKGVIQLNDMLGGNNND
ncbi:MAG: UvrD-helicase domain-containing protein [Succinivibrionaceae bacterium]